MADFALFAPPASNELAVKYAGLNMSNVKEETGRATWFVGAAFGGVDD
jgi:hypothetical protein